MALVVPNEGEQVLLSIMLGIADSQAFKLRLFTGVYGPINEDTVAEGDQQASGVKELAVAGYAAATLTHNATAGQPGWFITTTNGVTTAMYTSDKTTNGAGVSFTMTAGCTVYGYYVTYYDADNDLERLCWIEQFPGSPYTLPAGGGGVAGGGTITIIPKITLD